VKFAGRKTQGVGVGAMSRFTRWSFNDQQRILSNEETFRRFVCENLDNMEFEAGARYSVLLAVAALQMMMLGAILWKLW
jgi:hypothetical protein